MRSLLFLINLLLGINCYAQEELDFRIRYRPGTEYKQSIEEVSNNERTYFGSNEVLIEFGVRAGEPIVNNSQYKIDCVLKTSSSTEADTFPCSIEFSRFIDFYISPTPESKRMSITTDLEGRVVPDGTIIYGHLSADHTVMLDSTDSYLKDADFAKLILRSIDSIFSQPVLPDKKLRLGERFSITTPTYMMFGRMLIDITITTTYMLVDISGGIAVFDILKEYILRTPPSGCSVTITGVGKGELQYNTANNLYEKYRMEIEREVNFKNDYVQITDKHRNVFTRNMEVGKP